MIVVDANVLLYAYNAGTQQHEKARVWVERVFSGTETVGIPWSTIHAFLRVGTHSKVFSNPYTAQEAVDIVHTWFAAPAVDVLEPGERHWEILARLLVASQATGALVPDAALAALAIEHGATLATSDRDFRRFDGLKLVDPIAG